MRDSVLDELENELERELESICDNRMQDIIMGYYYVDGKVKDVVPCLLRRVEDNIRSISSQIVNVLSRYYYWEGTPRAKSKKISTPGLVSYTPRYSSRTSETDVLLGYLCPSIYLA